MPKDEKALRRDKTEDKGGNAPEDWSGGQDGEKGEVGRLKLQVATYCNQPTGESLHVFT